MGIVDDAREYIVSNKLRSIGVLWATGLGGSLAYQWSRPIPTSLKIIHSRVYAQALTLGSLAAVALVEHYDHRNETKRHHTRLEEIERRWGFGSEGAKATEAAK